VDLYDRLKGEKSLRIIAINDDEKEAYTVHTTQGGVIKLFCTERIYELSYSSWWCANELHKSYKVYGKCEGAVPERLAELIGKGITLGSMLPNALPRERQKKEAIHVYASLLANELEKEKNK
jgi:hypothetical protein